MNHVLNSLSRFLERTDYMPSTLMEFLLIDLHPYFTLRRSLLISTYKKCSSIEEHFLYKTNNNYFLFSIHFLAFTKASNQGETSSFCSRSG